MRPRDAAEAASAPVRPLGLASELISAFASGESSPVGSSATIVARARRACDSASFASPRKFQRPRAEYESPFVERTSTGTTGLSGGAPVLKTVCPVAPEPAPPPIAWTKPVGEMGPARTTTVFGSGRFATVWSTVVKLRSIWRDWPSHSTLPFWGKTYDRGRVFAGFSSAFFSAGRSDVNAERRRTPLSRR